MIQRIQSLYLIGAIAIMVLMFFFPIAGYYGELHTSVLYLLGIRNMVPDSPVIFSTYTTLPILFFVVCIIIVSFTVILLYKRRLQQMKLIKLNILLNTILIMGIFIVYSRWLQASLNATESFKTAAFFPLISMVFFVLAYRGVKKDDNLVKSADRLR